MNWFVETLRANPAIAIFLTIGLGFLLGKLKYKTFSLGSVTSVLLVGVVVGQLDIEVSGPMKSVFFLLFLFAIGYSVGPQFFRALRGAGLKQVGFAVVMCLLVLLCTWGVAMIFGYNVGEAAGLFAGAQTISAVMGVADDTIRTLNASAADKASWTDIMPVAYAVTYIFGTIGSAWILGTLGPVLLGGIKKVKAQTAELAKQMNEDPMSVDPAFYSAERPVVFRAYKAQGDFFSRPRTVAEIEQYIQSLGRRIFIERLRVDGTVVSDVRPTTSVKSGDELVLSGRREFVIQDESWIGPEVADGELLRFPVESIPVMVAKKGFDGTTVGAFRQAPYAQGVIIAKITRAGEQIPVLAKTELQRGDMIQLEGLAADVNAAAAHIGYVDRPTTVTDMVFVGLGIFIGALIGAITIHFGGIPVSLSTSGGALIAGLVLGWWRSKKPTFGHIPDSAVWLLNNMGLNMFIAVIGISAGPTFVSGLAQMGWGVLLAGILATSLPLLLGILIGSKIFKFHPAICLGCVAGARTTTAALGAVQDTLGSTIPAMGYTVTYAIGNTLLILMGLAICLLI